MSRTSKNKSKLFLEQLLLEYCIRQIAKYENDVIGLTNSVMYRRADPIDHLEMIMAQTRLATCEKIALDVQHIIEMSRNR